MNQSCGSGSSPLLLALEYGRADVVLALIRAGASLEHRDPYSHLTPTQVINDRCDAGRMDRRVCDEVRHGFEARAEAHNNLCDPRWCRPSATGKGTEGDLQRLVQDSGGRHVEQGYLAQYNPFHPDRPDVERVIHMRVHGFGGDS